ncbi:hypothetical protein [Dickeya solani]|uniref:hypothetical protein n=1 Tax=Dickeya solani TaxID=1089444 RepID=UPI000AF59898|nr:hypothetical protein [Dickeya solani]MBJ2330630.1 hypothetical protein [Dickeya solani]MBJ2339928.1 hypothetical protein [Dickeya solani]MBJ2344307.1 hypothetical protein [Dickeya solani]MBJ2353067.1 hypothetical protein [Dickeya solani]MCZ0787137.1 hypothetical protein [Dickeya solani]
MKVPLGSYYFPDDDEIVRLARALMERGEPGSERHPSSHDKEKISAGAQFCIRHGIACHVCISF